MLCFICTLQIYYFLSFLGNIPIFICRVCIKKGAKLMVLCSYGGV
ncbi:hypothetical protein HMPREF0653_01966 [Prevotella disiens JCM 6334 = ATCC 29426]|uniref:Uncharacterized protein n=1 Tax=Prevotella disiens JCM 6334 = ATCC 29426 TaxID=1235811 RepID=A0ABP2Y6G0_9BACT|nr:hypothetical protein HMPREF0653_01966 [Prevotella disiens JCM 6334 = ATCC 29426]